MLFVSFLPFVYYLCALPSFLCDSPRDQRLRELIASDCWLFDNYRMIKASECVSNEPTTQRTTLPSGERSETPPHQMNCAQVTNSTATNNFHLIRSCQSMRRLSLVRSSNSFLFQRLLAFRSSIFLFSNFGSVLERGGGISEGGAYRCRRLCEITANFGWERSIINPFHLTDSVSFLFWFETSASSGYKIWPVNVSKSQRKNEDWLIAENPEGCAGCRNRLASSEVIDLQALWPLEWFLEPLAGQLHSVTECSWDLVIQWMDVLSQTFDLSVNEFSGPKSLT